MKKFIIKKLKMVQAKENYKAEYLFYINNNKRKFK